jgi:hypothetical protein
MIAVKYAYINKRELNALWHEEYDKKKTADFHNANNMVTGWMSLSFDTIYRELDMAAQRCGHSMEELKLYFRRSEQLRGFVAKAQYDTTQCSNARLRNFHVVESKKVKISNAVTVEAASTPVGSLAVSIILAVEKMIEPQLKFFKGVNFVIQVCFITTPFIARAIFAENHNPFTSAGCLPPKSAALDYVGLLFGKNATSDALIASRHAQELNITTDSTTYLWQSPYCGYTAYAAATIISQIFLVVSAWLNLFVILSILLSGAVTFRRKELYLKEVGILVQRHKRLLIKKILECLHFLQLSI